MAKCTSFSGVTFVHLEVRLQSLIHTSDELIFTGCYTRLLRDQCPFAAAAAHAALFVAFCRPRHATRGKHLELVAMR